MDTGIAILAGVTGYLIGSISFARIVVRMRAPGVELSNIVHTLEDSKQDIRLQCDQRDFSAPPVGDAVWMPHRDSGYPQGVTANAGL